MLCTNIVWSLTSNKNIIFFVTKHVLNTIAKKNEGMAITSIVLWLPLCLGHFYRLLLLDKLHLVPGILCPNGQLLLFLQLQEGLELLSFIDSTFLCVGLHYPFIIIYFYHISVE